MSLGDNNYHANLIGFLETIFFSYVELLYYQFEELVDCYIKSRDVQSLNSETKSFGKILRIVIAILGVCLLGPIQLTAAAVDNNSSSLFSSRFTHGDGEYEISSVRLSWFKARNLCRSLGKDLVSIESSAENIAILSAISSFSTESFWSAGTRLYSEDVNFFYWDSTGLSVDSYTNWAPGQPDDTHDYVRIWHEYDHQWDAAPHSYELLFICEWHPCVQSV